MSVRIFEITNENADRYIDQIADLEVVVLNAMEKEGRKGQLFITGKEDILEYINSSENSVFVSVDDEDKVQSAAYITQGQKPYTYNDITKYYKKGNE